MPSSHRCLSRRLRRAADRLCGLVLGSCFVTRRRCAAQRRVQGGKTAGWAGEGAGQPSARLPPKRTHGL
eukprot:360884-Chlamydomonas_euryale.AAC.3